MGGRVYEESIIVLTMKTENKEHFIKWMGIMDKLLKRQGLYVSSRPPEKINGTYVKRYILNADTSFVKKAVQMISDMKSDKGFVFGGSVYKAPDDIAFSMKVEKSKIIQKTLKNLEEKRKLPKTTAEEILARKAGKEPSTLVARSKNLDKLKEFVNNFEKDMEMRHCPVVKSDIYRCSGKREINSMRPGMQFAKEFICRKGYHTIVHVKIPANPEETQDKSSLISVTFEPIINKYKDLLPLFDRFPEFKKLAEQNIPFYSIRNKYPQLIDRFMQEFNMGFAEKYEAYRAAWAYSQSMCTVYLYIEPESENFVGRTLVSAYIDGKAVTRNSTLPTQDYARIPVTEGKPHSLIINVSGYVVKEVVEYTEYLAVIWFLAGTRCLHYAFKVREQNKDKIMVKAGTKYTPNTHNCKLVSQ